MKLSELSTYLQKLEETSSRNDITTILSDLLKKVDASEVDKVIYLLSGGIGPWYKRTEFQIAERLMVTIVARAYGIETAEAQKKYKELGDIGKVAEELATKANQKMESDVKLLAIYEDLEKIAQQSGDGSVERKVDGMATILKKLDPLSAKYISRVPTGNLRLGFSDKTVIDALSVMECGTKEKSKHVGRAYEVVPDLGMLAQKIKESGIEKATKDVSPVIGVPVMPMLCARLKSPAEMIKKMGEVSVEPKFDGLRVLIHYSKPKKILKAFTRNLKDISQMFPELSKVGDYVNAEEFILDSEAVGMDPELLQMADFQTTMKRRRKHGIEESQKAIPLTFQVFDILYADENLMDTPYLMRRAKMETIIKKDNPLLKIDEHVITDEPKVIAEMHIKFRSKGLEGIIVKKKDGLYIPGRTGWNWVKMKEAEDATGKLSDTIDAVIMGYTGGRGKRVGFGIGQFLVGVKDKDKFVTLTKVGTGLSDVQFQELATRLKKAEVDVKPEEYEVHKDYTPDYWVKPEIVVELAGDDLTLSPRHTALYALRFPRLVKFRDDKAPSGATTVKEVKKLFELQKV